MIAQRLFEPRQSRWIHIFCIAFLAATFVLAAVVPPFQAPDEFEHVKREFMLSRGQILLKSHQGQASGGRIDTGLMEYMTYFSPIKGNALRKVSKDELFASSQVHWAGSESFEISAVSGSYFPALYAPAAIGLSMGKIAELSVSQSYRLARYFSLLTCALLLAAAIRLHTPPPSVLALFALPMNLFLTSAAVLDGMALATFTLGISAFFRVITDGENATNRAFTLLTTSIALVAACRANALAMLLLPFIGALYTKKRSHAIYAGIAAMLVVAWTLYTVSHTIYPATGRHVDNAGRLAAFVTHPFAFLSLLWNTVTDMSILSFYGYSFVGILGWFDAALPLWTYPILAAILGISVITSINVKNVRYTPVARVAVLVAVVGTLLLTFLALLVQWTPSGATTIDGVQGRYFMIPAVALAYMFAAGPHPSPAILKWTGNASVAVLLAASATVTIVTVVARYHTEATPPIAAKPAIFVSEPLARDRPISLHFSGAQQNDPAALTKIAIRFGTYNENHPGLAELRLWTADGKEFARPFALSSLKDNAYEQFTLDGKAYVRGDIHSLSGEGVSAYESAAGLSDHLTCIIVETPDTSRRTTYGCPDAEP